MWLQYLSKVSYLPNENFMNVPADIVQDLRRMLNSDEHSRPSALDFTSTSLDTFASPKTSFYISFLLGGCGMIGINVIVLAHFVLNFCFTRSDLFYPVKCLATFT